MISFGEICRDRHDIGTISYLERSLGGGEANSCAGSRTERVARDAEISSEPTSGTIRPDLADLSIEGRRLYVGLGAPAAPKCRSDISLERSLGGGEADACAGSRTERVAREAEISSEPTIGSIRPDLADLSIEGRRIYVYSIWGSARPPRLSAGAPAPYCTQNAISSPAPF